MKKGIKFLYKYIFLLILAAALCVGVVYARYSNSQSGSAEVEISSYGCSYSIDGVSATTFNNITYASSSSNVPRGITYTINNYDTDDSSSSYSEVDVQAVFRFSAQYILLSDMAFQIVDSLGSAITPQYDLSAIIKAMAAAASYGVDSATYLTGAISGETADNTGVTNGYYVVDANDYGEYSGSFSEQKFTITQQTDSSGYISKLTAVASDGTTITLRSGATSYSDSNITLSFGRNLSSGTGTAGPVYADIGLYADSSNTLVSTKTNIFNYYYLDIAVPTCVLEGGAQHSDTYTFYFLPLSRHEIKACFGTTNTDSTLQPTTYSITDPTSGTYDYMYYTTTNAVSGGTDYYYNQIMIDDDTYYAYVDSIRYDVSGITAYTDSSKLASLSSTISVRVKKDKDGCSYYYYDGEEYLEFEQDANYTNIYSVEYGGDTLYVDISSGNYANPLTSYDSSAATFTMSTSLNTINYPTYAQVIFVQASESGSSSSVSRDDGLEI